MGAETQVALIVIYLSLCLALINQASEYEAQN